MKRKLTMFLAVCLMAAVMAAPAYALEYTFDAPEQALFAEPTSDETIYVGAKDTANIDRGKNTALIPPAFGSPTSYLPGSGELLTPNLASGQTVGVGNTAQNSGHSISIPPVTPSGTPDYTATGYTAVTSDLYYAGGHLGTLSIPDIKLSVKVYQGTDNATLAKGAGHFASTSIWDGNIAVAAHNRGVNNHFGKIHTLSVGDEITFKTKLGTRTYEVYSVAKIAYDDLTVLDDTADNIITLVTCVMNQPSYRWCVQAKETK